MHCDTIMALMHSNQELRQNEHMISLDKLKKGDYLLQCFAMFVPYASKEDQKYSLNKLLLLQLLIELSFYHF